MIEFLPPALLPFFGALLIAFTRNSNARAAVMFVTSLGTIWLVWQLSDGVTGTAQFLGYTLEVVESSPVRQLFATIFALMMFVGGLFAYQHASRLELAAAFAYGAGAIGVAFAGDLLTMFVFWEAMAIFSTMVVWCGGTPQAQRAGIRYAIMHIFGGVVLMVGIVGIAVETGSVDITNMRAESIATWLILIGVLVNAAAPPISAWLADAYPEASATGTVFLSAFTTKAAVLALILLFPGEPILVWVGLYMIFYGIIYALLENDARRILAYSIVNQVGFMVCAVGIGTELALNGAAAHAFAHIIYKALLFMSAGVVLYRTGQRKCTDLGGLFRTMPVTCLFCIIGALSISSFPLTSGFTTKALISEAAVNEGLALVYFLLLAASAGVFLHAGIKFPWFVFFQKDSGLRPKDAPWNMTIAMAIFAALCIFLGIFPQALYAYLPYPVSYEAYTGSKLVLYLQLLLFSGLAFFLLLPAMKRTLTISLDIDWLWRGPFYRLSEWTQDSFQKGNEVITRGLRGQLDGLQNWSLHYWGIDGTFSRSWPIGTTALWIAVLLSTYVLLYYL